MERPYSLSDYVAEVKEYIKTNGIRSPFVFAHSFGARIALKAAAEERGVFKKLALCGAAGLKPRFSLRKALKKTIFRLLKKFIKKEKLARFYSEDYRSLSPVMRESFIKIVNEFLDEKVKNIAASTLLIFGKKDKETPVYMGRRLNKRIKNSTLYVVRGAGHFAFVEKPREISEKIKEFFLG